MQFKMDRAANTKRNDLERMLLDKSAEPTDLPLSLLEDITNGFSDDKQIGAGGFAVVYMGTLGNGTVAVKKLSHAHLHEKKFHQEVECLMKVKHKNVVRFLGYCSDTQGKMECYNGKLVMADVQQRLLCFEYLPKGSLHDHITDTSHQWRQCYQIIKGICEGLHYLHHNRIVHSDLKPANILLDDNMVPKIADFGLSRCFDENQSRVITSKLFGSLGYLAPEFHCGIITFKSDIYSLGVIIIEILAGQKVYPEDKDVLELWRNRLEKSQGDKQLEQLRACAEIGKECTDYNPARRPDAWLIVDRLDKLEIMDESIETGLSNLSIEQAENSSDGLHQGTPKVPRESSEADQHVNGRELIGAIGRDLSMQCLLRLSRSDYGLVASLNRHFMSLVRNGEIYNLRRQNGVAEHWIYVSCSILQWDAYDPYRGQWIQVPKMPIDEMLSYSHKDSLAVGSELLVFGACIAFSYSILHNSWHRVYLMNSPRSLFGSASVGEKAYVAGGIDYSGMILSSAEMYDSARNRWTHLPSMNRARMLCCGVFLDGKFCVIGGLDSNRKVLTCGEEYDLKQQSWRLIENMSEGLNQVTSGAPPLIAAVNNELYAADYSEKDVKKYDKQNNRWITLGELPELVGSVEGWGLAFQPCGDRLFVIASTRSRIDGKIELYSWVPDEQPLVWNLIARGPCGNFLYNSVVMSC